MDMANVGCNVIKRYRKTRRDFIKKSNIGFLGRLVIVMSILSMAVGLGFLVDFLVEGDVLLEAMIFIPVWAVVLVLAALVAFGIIYVVLVVPISFIIGGIDNIPESGEAFDIMYYGVEYGFKYLFGDWKMKMREHRHKEELKKQSQEIEKKMHDPDFREAFDFINRYLEDPEV